MRLSYCWGETLSCFPRQRENFVWILQLVFVSFFLALKFLFARVLNDFSLIETAREIIRLVLKLIRSRLATSGMWFYIRLRSHCALIWHHAVPCDMEKRWVLSLRIFLWVVSLAETFSLWPISRAWNESLRHGSTPLRRWRRREPPRNQMKQNNNQSQKHRCFWKPECVNYQIRK